ncbi:MAG: two-component system, OmpR family, operon response regulator KdpE [Chloroflexota bacterium]|nr:two-component system, OmpR family, operon response regulator KdpE [Chloroflexota bacterium]
MSRQAPQVRILLVEDDETTRGWLARDLATRGYRVDEAGDVATALARWDAHRPDAILLDLGLPDRDGIAVVRRVRREAATPILIVSARGAEASKVEALEQGADDYLTKPFGTPELHARLRAVLRRAGGPAADIDGRIRNDAIALDPLAHRVTVHDQPTSLAPREFELLRVLLDHPGRLVTRGRILRAVWGAAYDDESHYIHVYVSQLRRKIARADPDGCLSDLLVAEPGVGYRVRAARADGAEDHAGDPERASG